jgi:hypothetical protein
MDDKSSRKNAILKMLSIASTEASRLRAGVAASRNDCKVGLFKDIKTIDANA